jgi:UDP-N-acetyl-2-amino-2-deoxyglucuronate dehydrogenase
MSEKPMATRWADGQAMVKACDRAGVRLFVVKQNRFNSTIQLVRRQLEAGRFGRLAMVTANVFWTRPQAYYDNDAWRGTWEFDGGALMNQASHYVDLLDWLIGPVQSVSASMATIGRRIEVEDTAALQLRWRNGCLGTMAVTMLTYPRDLEGSITILGETGSVKVAGAALNRITHWQFADSQSDDGAVEESGYQPSSVYGFGHPHYYANVLASLQGDGEALCDGREGLRSLELLIGAYRSARDGVTTHLPLDF